VGAIAIAYPTQITEPVIGAAGIIFGVLLLFFSNSGLIDKLAQLFSQPVTRGIQLALCLIFLKKGIELMITKDLFMSGVTGRFPDSSINLILGMIVSAMVLVLLDNKKLPAANAALATGILSGLLLGGLGGQKFAIGPTEVRLLFPTAHDYRPTFIMLLLPQIPLTIGNACVGTADTCGSLFPKNPLLARAQAGKFAFTMGIANLPAGF
jgi:SulP family sulfate permease